MRLAALDRLAPGFEDDMQGASGGLATGRISGRSPITRPERLAGFGHFDHRKAKLLFN
jgi:hypothetical protein